MTGVNTRHKRYSREKRYGDIMTQHQKEKEARAIQKLLKILNNEL